ncbi:uncharacterized protein ACBT57_005545 [Dama dama]
MCLSNVKFIPLSKREKKGIGTRHPFPTPRAGRASAFRRPGGASRFSSLLGPRWSRVAPPTLASRRNARVAWQGSGPCARGEHGDRREAHSMAENREPRGTVEAELDPVEYTLRKRLPHRLPRRPNDIYVNMKTDFKAQLARCQKLLD